MPRIPYRYPAAGADPIADLIRERRGARGLTPLDGALLNAPPIANGWNTLLGAVRSNNSIPDDVREMMILRVAAHNSANFEWFQHAPVAEQAGCTTAQLAAVRDVNAPLSAQSSLSPLAKAALALADDMTTKVRVDDSTFSQLKSAFTDNVKTLGDKGKIDGFEDDELVNRKIAETTLTVAVYNMVSRFLVAVDVDDRANLPVPKPKGSEHVEDPVCLTLPITGPSSSAGRGLVQLPDGQLLSTRVHFHRMTAPWIVLINSLMTNLTMWDAVIPALSSRFNILTYDQRGHGSSAVPAQACTIAQLSDDVAFLLDSLAVNKAFAVIGVSQGGATALSFALRHPHRYERLVACDTQPSTPAANVAAWDERIALAKSKGMAELAAATVPRWFGPGSQASAQCRATTQDMVISTNVKGFEAGARALQSYDLVKDGIVEALSQSSTRGQTHLLLAGEADGKLPETLQGFANKLNEAGAKAEFVSIPKAGHLPMCDNPEAWLQTVLKFLA
ncbi:related to 3-oxoadipate enol-lactone hydrolase [Melanopsichium pennsylvanicum]|uniref:Related to 3-oxoadipate enol-lactone hydrolase n=2 Tax=Melanopsichium pennsylvanicum TaxID=63383 RepID=A0AAJ4XT35_9BASI|nr:related to 3-oxoadipate enol-lactone hydrolase [Melanopsichium pennsylvanicum 4]SNX87888.1 related to 3-oxoadipate enol-lactone hydrolase [Melanopsichium pennsylvanicum]